MMQVTTEEPLLTIGIPTYNRSDFLERLVKRLISQIKGFNAEIFVCDDCSTDDTIAVMNRLILQNPDVAIRFVENESNLDFSRNFNKTIKQSRGKFVLLMANDDSVDDGVLPLVINILERHSDIALGFLASQDYDNALEKPAAPFVPGEDKYYEHGMDLINEIRCCVPCLISGWILRKEYWLAETREEYMESNALQIPIGMKLLAKYPCYCHRSTPAIRYRTAGGTCGVSGNPLWPYSGLNAYFHGARVMKGVYSDELYRSIYFQAVRTTCGHTIRCKVLGLPFRLVESEALLKPYFDYEWPCCIWTLLLRLLLRLPRWVLYVPFRWLVPEKM